MVLYLIGPSHAGKTGSAELFVSKFPESIHIDFDLCHINKNDWSEALRHFQSIEKENVNNPNIVLVDIGAMTQDLSELKDFFIDKLDRVILIYRNFEINKESHKGRDEDEFRQKEYSKIRFQLYNIVYENNRLDLSDCNQENGKIRFLEFLERFLML